MLSLVFEERDANFRIVPFVCGCLERNGNHVVFVFLMTQRRFLRIRIKEGEKFIGRIFYIPLPLVEAILKRIL